MSIRDVLLKSSALGYNTIVIISEWKGNPSRIDVYGPEGDLILNLDITVSNSLSSGKIDKNNLSLRWELDNPKENNNKKIKEKIISLIKVPENSKKAPESFNKSRSTEQNSYKNLILLKEGTKGSKAVVEFYDQQGTITGPVIYIHQCSMVGM